MKFVIRGQRTRFGGVGVRKEEMISLAYGPNRCLYSPETMKGIHHLRVHEVALRESLTNRRV